MDSNAAPLPVSVRHVERQPRHEGGGYDPPKEFTLLEPHVCLEMYRAIWETGERHAKAYTLSVHCGWGVPGVSKLGRRVAFDAQAAKAMGVRRDYVRRLRCDAQTFLFGHMVFSGEHMKQWGVRTGARAIRGGYPDEAVRERWVRTIDAMLAEQFETYGVDPWRLSSDGRYRETALRSVLARMKS